MEGRRVKLGFIVVLVFTIIVLHVLIKKSTERPDSMIEDFVPKYVVRTRGDMYKPKTEEEKIEFQEISERNELKTGICWYLQNTRELEPTSHRVGGNRKRSSQSINADQKSIETVFFDCHLSPVERQMTIENSVSNNFY